MINYWLDKINKDKEIIEKINKILEQNAAEEKEEQKDWELDL